MGKEVGATTTREGSLNSKMARGESQGEDWACFLTFNHLKRVLLRSSLYTYARNFESRTVSIRWLAALSLPS